ncbi:MAG: hypothetical protein QM628_18480 [Propionicimonas sp.]
MRQHHVPGVLAVTYRDGGSPPDLTAMLAAEGLQASITQTRDVVVASWDLTEPTLSAGRPLLLSGTNWGDDGAITAAEVGRWLEESDLPRLGSLLPPFGALGQVPEGVRAVADSMGFRQLFRSGGDGWAAVSTSARLLARLGDTGIDDQAVLLQSQLGWQLGQRTFFRGVTKLAPGESILLAGGRSQAEHAPEPDPEAGSVPLAEGVRQAAALLRTFLEQYLDEVDAPTLQLTGGQDSRLLLSAIPPARRKGLKVMTLDAPGTRDAEVAAALAARYRMTHTVRSMSGLGELGPQEWFARVWRQASIHDCMADPIARAATAWAEESFEQGHRLSGLGGELGRGFFYTGWVRPRPITRSRSERLARWRMFANEPVEPAALAVAHRERALPLALDLADAALSEGGPEWYRATDELYYRHRMQRWAGLGESVVCFERTLTNPMLDHRFRAIVRALAPHDKQNSRFLGQLQVALDDELARIPLDDRPPPSVYARPGPVGFLRQRATKLGKLTRKVRQRLEGSRRPPPGGAVVANRVTEYLTERPELLDPVRGLGLFDEEWLDGVTRGTVRPAPSSLALLVNAAVAADPGGGREIP